MKTIRYYGKMTSRVIKRAKMNEMRKEWASQGIVPKSLRKVIFFVPGDNQNEMMGLSLWDSKADCDKATVRLEEQDRQSRMRPFIEKVNWQRFFDVWEVEY